MPTAPRPNKKAEKIAFDILGVPPAFQKQKRTEKERETVKRLNYEESLRVR